MIDWLFEPCNTILNVFSATASLFLSLSLPLYEYMVTTMMMDLVMLVDNFFLGWGNRDDVDSGEK